jgi:hypothetical protein
MGRNEPKKNRTQRNVKVVLGLALLFAIGALASGALGQVTETTGSPTDTTATTTDTTTTTTTSTDTTATTTTDTTPTSPPPSEPASSPLTPTISSDLADYPPGATVTLTGAGWGPGESVHLFVNDDAGQTWSYNVDVTADAFGGLTNTFNLPNWFVANYSVTATGTASGTATTSFTDGNVNVKTAGPASANVDWRLFNNTTCAGGSASSGTIIATNAGNGTAIPGSATAAQSLRLTAASVSGFTFTSWSGGNVSPDPSSANPICVAGQGPTQNITLTYTAVATDATPPDTSITANPSNPSNSSSASFSFTGTDNVTPAGSLTFECKLDAAAFASCSSPKAYSSLSDGSHTFQVRAIDAATNVDASPASFTWTVDAAAPDTSILTGPSGATSNASPSFTYSSTEAGSTFECKLDGPGATTGSFASCLAAGKSYVGLADGSYTFSVRATDAAGNTDPTPATRSFTVDTVAPDTTIDSQPADPSNSSSAAFTFSGSDPAPSSGGVTFECKLDAGLYAACSSPKSYTALAEGSHTFSVRAKDAAGNTDATPATFAWYVDLTPPETQIDTHPTALTNSSSATFTFSGSDDHSSSVSFECKLDGGTFASCSSPKTYTVADGSHTFSVRAIDAAGNTDPTPASFTWYADLIAPDTTITSVVPAANSTSATFTFSGSDNHSAPAALTFACKLDAGAYAACSSPKTYSGLSVGPHTFSVRATDEASNTDATPATQTWSVLYVFIGFLQPVDNNVLNSMKAGSTAPIKWQLKDPTGTTYITDTAVVVKAQSGVMACSATTPVDNLEEYATGGTQLRYDLTANQFIYNWQSPNKSGQCYQVVLTFADGSTHTAMFQLK